MHLIEIAFCSSKNYISVLTFMATELVGAAHLWLRGFYCKFKIVLGLYQPVFQMNKRSKYSMTGSQISAQLSILVKHCWWLEEPKQ